jgi:hypothetical protein
MTSAQHESRGDFIGSFPYILKAPPRTSSLRTKWHTFSSNARGLLCFHPPGHAYQDHWPSSNKVALHTPERNKSSMSPPSSRDSTAPSSMTRSRSYQVRRERVAQRTMWEDKTTAITTKFPQTGNKPPSEAAASDNAPLIDDRGTRRPRLASSLYDDHAVDPPHFNETQTGTEGGEHHCATGDTLEALIDALMQIGDSEEWDSVSSMGTSSSSTEASFEMATDDQSEVGVEVGEKWGKSSAGAWEGADGRRAWEAMKRRVIHIEEYGTLPPDAMDHGAERSSREFRARRRRSWAEQAIRGHAREEASRRAAAKKRRRHAGCWVRENGAITRLVRDFFHFFPPFLHLRTKCPVYSFIDFFSSLFWHLWTHPLFTVRTSNMRPTRDRGLGL